MPINHPPYLERYSLQNALHMALRVIPIPQPEMRMSVNPGQYWFNGTVFKEYAGGLTEILTPPGSDYRWDLVCMDTTLELPSVIKGTPGAVPTPPTCIDTWIPLAWIYMYSGMTEITEDDIFDARPFIQIQREIDASAVIVVGGGGSGIPLTSIGSGGESIIHSLVAGPNITIDADTPVPGDVTISSTGGAGGDIDCGLFTD